MRHQVVVLRRQVRGRVRLTNFDRLFLVQLYRWFPSILRVLAIVQPETVIRWHRAGFRCSWRWKSRSRGGRPQIDTDVRALIRQMSMENPLWGAPRIHGELLKLGFEVPSPLLPSTWSSAEVLQIKDGARSGGTTHRTSPPWTCLSFRPLASSCSMPSSLSGWTTDSWSGSTSQKSDGGLDRAQLTEAFPWDGAPRYLIRDRDRIYGAVVMRRIRAMGIRDKPIAPSSPWQNGFAERLIGSIRRECADHFVVLGEAHLRRILRAYADYYNDIRTHRSLDKDAPVSRPVQRTGNIISRPILGGIHHHYVRG